MATPKGYSGTPLAKKLGIKNGFTVMISNAPAHYFDLFPDLPEINITDHPQVRKELIHHFTKEAESLENELIAFKNQLKPTGMIWVSWPKKSFEDSYRCNGRCNQGHRIEKWPRGH